MFQVSSDFQTSSFSATPRLTEGNLTAAYDAVAESWHGRVSRLGYLSAYTRLIQDLRLAPPQKMLDCGVGTGALSLAVLQTCGTPARLCGIDISTGMLTRAQGIFNAVGVEAELEQADCRSLPYADGVFDLVASAHMLEHLIDPLLALAEMQRVLRPSGALLLVISRSHPASKLIQRRWGHITYDASSCARVLREAGLSVVQIQPLSVGLARWTSFAVLARKPAPVWAFSHLRWPNNA